jgi:hypothetical protein
MAFLALPASEGQKFLKKAHSILTRIVRGRRANKDYREGKRKGGRQGDLKEWKQRT